MSTAPDPPAYSAAADAPFALSSAKGSAFVVDVTPSSSEKGERPCPRRTSLFRRLAGPPGSPRRRLLDLLHFAVLFSCLGSLLLCTLFSIPFYPSHWPRLGSVAPGATHAHFAHSSTSPLPLALSLALQPDGTTQAGRLPPTWPVRDARGAAVVPWFEACAASALLENHGHVDARVALLPGAATPDGPGAGVQRPYSWPPRRTLVAAMSEAGDVRLRLDSRPGRPPVHVSLRSGPGGAARALLPADFAGWFALEHAPGVPPVFEGTFARRATVLRTDAEGTRIWGRVDRLGEEGRLAPGEGRTGGADMLVVNATMGTVVVGDS